MNNIPCDMAEVLAGQISGFHQYILSGGAPRMSYVSRNLCCMLGAEEDELLGGGYEAMVHPADREAYFAMLRLAAGEERTAAGEYRLVKKDGSVMHVRDTVTSRLTDGVMVMSSVLADITGIRKEIDDLHFLSETIPCGFLKYTCEKQPRITYINARMAEMLRLPAAHGGEDGELEYFLDNVYLMIPAEERRRFARYLDRVYAAGTPVAGEMSLLRCDGTRVHVFGWVTKSVNELGEAEFQSVCMDVTERHMARRAAETERYIKALAEVYDKIFEINLSAGTVKCLHCGDSATFKCVENMAVRLEDAKERWIMDSVVEDDCGRVRGFFDDFCGGKAESALRPPQITYMARSGDGKVRRYGGIFIRGGGGGDFYCCRRMHDPAETEVLRHENDRLKENMKKLVMRFTDGIAAFEISSGGMVTPLYASDNVCAFFGFSRDEWFSLMAKATPLENFVAYSEAEYEDFEELLRNGEAEFTYFDYSSGIERRIRAVCSRREPEDDAPLYVMLYYAGPDRGAEEGLPEPRSVTIRTFGYFDVFVGDRPIAFRNKKSKELFALLVDRRGGYVTSEEAIGFLWEDEPVSTVTLSRYRKVALRLKNTLEEYGIADVVESVDGKRRIVAEKVRCDLYDYLSGKDEFAQLFKGSYLTNYSWAETTLGELTESRMKKS